MAAAFPHVPEALDNSLRIAEACYSDWHFGDQIFPAFRQLTDHAAFLTLKTKSYAGAQERYGLLSEGVRARIEKELRHPRETLRALFSDRQEILTEPLTCSRGCGPPDRLLLPQDHARGSAQTPFVFERFLNPGRKDPPDIDIDFPWDKRAMAS